MSIRKNRKEIMKNLTVLLILISSLGLIGCSGKILGGAAGGILGAGAGYEYNARQQMNGIKDDLNAGKITQEEYDIRKDQIQKMSVLE